MSDRSKVNRFSSVHPAQCTLAEGPHWDPRTNRLLWVDIYGDSVHVWDPKSNKCDKIYAGKFCSLVVPTAQDPTKAYIALHDGIYLLDLATGEKFFLCRPETREEYRYNDGKLDCQGRLWVGSMHIDEKESKGKLFMVNQDGTFEERLDNIGVSNGMDWANNTMYYIDSPTKNIYAFDYNPEDGKISNKRVVVTVPPNSGVPDGMTLVTPNGRKDPLLVVAQWGGSGVYIYDPTLGSGGESALKRRLEIPAGNTTSCVFGGEGGADLFVTSAKRGRSPDQLAQEPHAGDIFVFKGLLNELV